MKLSYPVYYHGGQEVSSNFPAERRATVVSYDKTMERLGAFLWRSIRLWLHAEKEFSFIDDQIFTIHEQFPRACNGQFIV